MSTDTPVNEEPIDALGRVVAYWPNRTLAVRRASVWLRWLAALLDLFAVSLLIAVMASAWDYHFSLPFGIDFAVLIVSLVLLPLYGLLQLLCSASPGKFVCSLRVAQADGSKATARQRQLRYAIWLTSAIGLATYEPVNSILRAANISAELKQMGHAGSLALRFAGVLFIFGGLAAALPWRRSLHDWLSGTAVFLGDDLLRDEGGGIGFSVDFGEREDGEQR